MNPLTSSYETAQARRWAKTGATQQRILDAATEAFATRGFTATTMADVVAGSGASVGSIYHHFGGKSELFLAIFEQMADAVDRRIDAAMRQAGGRRTETGGGCSSCTCGPTSRRCGRTGTWPGC